MAAVATATLLPKGAATSEAVPIVQGTLVGESSMNMDAVPLIDANTAAVLARAGAFTIYQRPSFTEALLGCERSNIYDIYDGATGEHIMFAKERSECFNRLCCAPRRQNTAGFE